MSNDINVYKFQKDYPTLNNSLLKSSKELFEIGIIMARASELEKGFIVSKQLKTTSKGTRFNFVPAKDENELREYMKEIKDRLEAVDINKIESDIEKRIEIEC